MEIVIQLHPLLLPQCPKLALPSCSLRDTVSGQDRDGLVVGLDELGGFSNLNDFMFYLWDLAAERNTWYEKQSQAMVTWERDTVWSLCGQVIPPLLS